MNLVPVSENVLVMEISNTSYSFYILVNRCSFKKKLQNLANLVDTFFLINCICIVSKISVRGRKKRPPKDPKLKKIPPSGVPLYMRQPLVL